MSLILTAHRHAAEAVRNLIAAFALKSLSSSVGDYRDAVSLLVQESLRGSGRMSKADFRSGMKALIKTWAEVVYAEGWKDSDGDTDDIGPEEIATIDEFVSEQSSHVNAFSDWLKAPDSNLDDAPGRVDAWAVSMANLGQQASAKALGDPPLKFGGTDGVESCDECQEYVGQTHRMSWWEKRGLLKRNGNDAYGCGRWDDCKHHFFHAKTGEKVID